MSHHIRITFLAIIVLVGVAHSIKPPRPPWSSPYPWGKDTTEWVLLTQPWGPNQAIYNPREEAFYICGGKPVQWPNLVVEMFIEAELEIDFGGIKVPKNIDSPYYIYMHGNTLSDNPSGFQIVPLSGYSLDQLSNASLPTGDDPNGHWPIIAWEISTNGGKTYQAMAGNDMLRYFDFESWYNSFVIRLTIDPTQYISSGRYRLNAGLFPLPQN